MRLDRPTDFALAYLTIFRGIAVLAAATGATIGLTTNTQWLLAVSICVGLGELLETTYYITVMRWGQRRGTLPLSRARP